jgi:MFS family permease
MSTHITSTPKESWFINRNFVLLWIGQSISSVGDFFFSTTLTLWVATQLARGQSWTPLAVGGVAIANVLPLLLVGPFAGVFVDRWDKRRTMLRMDALRAIIVALLLFVIMLTSLRFDARDAHTHLWFLTCIYTTGVLISVCSQFFSPSRMAFIGDIVPDALRTRAISFTSISFNLSLIIGPSLAAPLYFAFGVQWAIAIDVLSFVVSFLAILAIRVPHGVTSDDVRQKKNFWREFNEGLRIFRRNKVLVVFLLAGMLFQLGAGPSNALYVLFAIQNLHAPRNLLGLFEANYGIGVILGLLVIAFFARRIGEARVFWLSFLLFGGCMVIFGRLTTFIPGLLMFFLLGFANAGIIVVVGPLMLRVTPRAFMGRVQSVNTPLITGSSLAATALAGVLASTTLHGFHASWFGGIFGPIDTIFSVSGFIVMSAGVYVLLALRKSNNVKLPETEIAQNV